MIYLLRVDLMTLIKYVMRKFYAGVCLYPNIYWKFTNQSHIFFPVQYSNLNLIADLNPFPFHLEMMELHESILQILVVSKVPKTYLSLF